MRLDLDPRRDQGEGAGGPADGRGPERVAAVEAGALRAGVGCQLAVRKQLIQSFGVEPAGEARGELLDREYVDVVPAPNSTSGSGLASPSSMFAIMTRGSARLLLGFGGPAERARHDGGGERDGTTAATPAAIQLRSTRASASGCLRSAQRTA